MERTPVSTSGTTARHVALRALHRIRWAPPLVARVTLGVLFVSTGWGKIHSLAKVSGFFAQLGIPDAPFFAGLVAWSELVCGGLLLVGLLSRLATIPLITTMIVALATAKASDVTSLPDLFGMVEWTYLALLLYVAIDGPGVVSLDAIVARTMERRASAKRRRTAKTIPMAPLGHNA